MINQRASVWSILGSESHCRSKPWTPLRFSPLLRVPRPRQRARRGHERGAQPHTDVPRERPEPQRSEPPQPHRVLLPAPSSFSPSVKLLSRVRLGHRGVPVRRRRVSPAASPSGPECRPRREHVSRVDHAVQRLGVARAWRRGVGMRLKEPSPIRRVDGLAVVVGRRVESERAEARVPGEGKRLARRRHRACAS